MNQILVLAFFALEVFAIYFAWRAIASSRTSQGAAGWVVFLIWAPYVGVPLYLFLGHHKYRGYMVARRESARVIMGIRRLAEANAPAAPPEIDPSPFERIGDLPAVRGNDLRLLTTGEQAFGAMFGAIDRAEKYILVQFYIVRDDALGRELRDRLVAAAGRGVDVRFMVDPVGSSRLPRSYYDSLAAAGARVVYPSDGRGPKKRFQLNFRNHRKTVIIDGKIGFTGGFNVGDEYMGRDPAFGNWRDTQAELRGPVVAQLQLVFTEDWHWAKDELILDSVGWEPTPAKRDMTGMLVATGPGDALDTGALFFLSAITAARRRLWIASPYCVPDVDVLSALKLAALRGVDVRLLLPDVVDHHLPWLAAFAYFDELRDAGIEIWRYDDGFMHQKAVLVDDALAAIGTSNLDNRSFRLNFEAMAVFFDRRAAAETEAMLEADFAKSFCLEKALQEQPAWIRFGAPIARLFSPIL